MGRFSGNDIDKYGNGGGAGYFSLKNDGDMARVRFLYNSSADIEGYAVHEVEIDGKKRSVNCLREYNEGKEKCPLCANGNYQRVKLYIPIYNIDEDKVQVWERGKKFFSKISSICERYNKKSIVSQIFEIERNGKPGDTQTTYEIYRSEDEPDDTTLEDFELPEILGSTLMDMSFEDMQSFVNGEELPFAEKEDNAVRRRTPAEPSRRTSARRRENF